MDPGVFGGDPPPPIEKQARAALGEVLSAISAVGGSADTVLRVEAFLRLPEHYAAWNEAYAEIWPVPGPARITLVTGFGVPGVEIEIQAVALCDEG